MVGAIDLELLRAAAEEAAWLCARGYSAQAVARFVGQERTLGERERRLLDMSARADAHHRHHIARELDPEDLARRPLRLEIHSVLVTVAAAITASQSGDKLLILSAAGLVCDPEPEPLDTAREATALTHILRAIVSLKPSAVRIVVATDNEPLADRVLEERGLGRKLKLEREVVTDVAKRLNGAANVVSADPRVLDGCGTWFNLAGMLARELGAPTLRLG